jgi:uncharacterized protein (DUF4213/DUF364 family)
MDDLESGNPTKSVDSMKKIHDASVLEISRNTLRDIIGSNRLYDVSVSVRVKTLTPEEAIGEPGRRDFPIIIGKERVIEADILGARAHAYTDSPSEFVGTLGEIIGLQLRSNRERAIYIATLNALLRYLNMIEDTLHCRDEDPERCANEIASHIFDKWGQTRVGLIGLNPAIADRLIDQFGKGNVRITDLNEENISSFKHGVEVWDGKAMTERIVGQSDVVLVTGTTLVNGTLDDILNYIRGYRTEYLIYGVTAAGICALMGLNRICPYARAQ